MAVPTFPPRRSFVASDDRRRGKVSEAPCTQKFRHPPFTSLAFTERLKGEGVAISMDGRGCWRDNVFVERLWRSVKYEEVYLRAYETVSQAREGISRYLSFFNTARPHTAHGGKTPDSAYFATLPAMRKRPDRAAQ